METILEKQAFELELINLNHKIKVRREKYIAVVFIILSAIALAI